MKTGKQIQGDIVALLKDSVLANTVNGKIYGFEHRPRDSKAEDIIVVFTTGFSEQIQTGVITLNIYVPDVENPDNGILTENERRCEDLEIAAGSWVESLISVPYYQFSLQQTIYTEAEPEINQHFVVVKLKYQLLEN
jgi:hypothetical protein